MHAHGGGVIKVGDHYYWFGENRNSDNTFRAVSVYRSTDLRDWEFRNDVLTQSSHPELQVANIERPKVIFNSSTGQFVMWMHKENGRGLRRGTRRGRHRGHGRRRLHLARQFPPA